MVARVNACVTKSNAKVQLFFDIHKSGKNTQFFQLRNLQILNKLSVIMGKKRGLRICSSLNMLIFQQFRKICSTVFPVYNFYNLLKISVLKKC